MKPDPSKSRKRRKAWDFPECPDCGFRLPVRGDSSRYSQWFCERCQIGFTTDPIREVLGS